MANLMNRVSGLVGKTGSAGRTSGGLPGKAASFVAGFLSGGEQRKGRRGARRGGAKRGAARRGAAKRRR